MTFIYLKETLSAPIPIGRLFNITTARKKPQHGIGSTDASAARQNENLDDDCPQAERPLPLRSLLTPTVLIVAGNYTSLSFVDMAFRAIQPVFFSTPIHLGGLGLPLPTIGTLLSVQGILNGIFQVFFFARVHDRWGSKYTFIAGISSALPAYAMFPVANVFARTQGYSMAVWIAIGIQTIAGMSINLCFG